MSRGELEGEFVLDAKLAGLFGGEGDRSLAALPKARVEAAGGTLLRRRAFLRRGVRCHRSPPDRRQAGQQQRGPPRQSRLPAHLPHLVRPPCRLTVNSHNRQYPESLGHIRLRYAAVPKAVLDASAYRGGSGTPRSCWSFCLLGSSGSPSRAQPRPSARGSSGCRCPAHSQYPPGMSAASSQIVSG